VDAFATVPRERFLGPGLRGDHVVHVGAGTGYYSAILAEMVGRTGRVTAIEIDPLLAARAKENLAAMIRAATPRGSPAGWGSSRASAGEIR
jgi:protein-L-isoaspartate(D-aspartate) O-methyltransferase